MDVTVSREDATRMWNALAERLDRFVETWDAGREPDFEEFLPTEPRQLRRLCLIEMIKVDLERRAERNRLLSLDEYARQFPELHEDGEPPLDVIYEDFHIRKFRGDKVSADDYYRRYPRQADALQRLLGEGEITGTTAMFGGHRGQPLSAGERIDDFDLLVELGKGAFGSVFLARQVSMQRLVALKVSADKGNEPQTLAQLDHANIIRVFDQRRLPERRLRLMYMQFAPGGTLSEVVDLVKQTPPELRTGGMLTACVAKAVNKTGTVMLEETSARRRMGNAPWAETVCKLGIQLAQALDCAHKQGVLHRDVKPANVLLSAEGSPKLADFNISFCSQLDGASPAAYFGGSLAYMSPEQLEACNPQHAREPNELDGRSDLYSLAVVLWELLHGERPFKDRNLDAGWSATLNAMAERRRAERPAPPLVGLNDPLAKRLEGLLLRTMSPRPADRPPDGAAFARELSLALHPRAWDLLHGLTGGWRGLTRRHPLIALTVITVPPFAIAGLFNVEYNQRQLIVPHPERSQIFWFMVVLVNSFVYPFGMWLVLVYAAPVARTLKKIVSGVSTNADERRRARLCSLRIGYAITLVSLVEWMFVGIVFPIGLDSAVGKMSAADYAHFLLSTLACGLISAGLPFLNATWLGVQVFFPALLAADEPDLREQRQLAALLPHAGASLVTTVVVPLLAMCLLFLTHEETRAAILIVIFLAACAGLFLVANWIYGRLRRDLAALAVAMRPSDALSTTESATEF